MKRIKRDGHGNSNNPAGNSSRSGAADSNSNAADKKSTPMQAQLSNSEKRVFERLKNVSTESLWGLGIKKAIESGDPDRFLSLIEQLQSQARDNPEVMQKILGSVYSSVMIHNCKV